VAEAEVPEEGAGVESPTSEEDELAGVPVVLDPRVVALVEVSLVAVELFLRVNVLEELGLVPPAIL
jgi:hypothetical protein